MFLVRTATRTSWTPVLPMVRFGSIKHASIIYKTSISISPTQRPKNRTIGYNAIHPNTVHQIHSVSLQELPFDVMCAKRSELDLISFQVSLPEEKFVFNYELDLHLFLMDAALRYTWFDFPRVIETPFFYWDNQLRVSGIPSYYVGLKSTGVTETRCASTKADSLH